MLIDQAAYIHGQRITTNSLRELYAKSQEENGFVWVGLVDPSESELFELGEIFGLHELHIEDAFKGRQRPKFDDYGDLDFITVKTLYYVEANSQVETGDFMIYLGPDFVITIRHGQGGALAGVRADLEKQPARLELGPHAVLHGVLDRVIDDYSSIALELENDVAEIERKVFTDAGKSRSAELYFLKREIIEFRRAVDPLRPIVNRFVVGQEVNPPAILVPFFQDLEDHLIRASDLITGIDQLISAAIQADLAQLQISQNSDMRKISAWVALAAAPTLLAGIYGMNFEHMPELSTPWGYPLALGFMLTLSGILFRKFKKSGWL
jgi:magnesium transporter